MYAAFVKWDRIAVRLAVQRPLVHMQQWLLRRSDLQLLAVAAAWSTLALVWRNPVRWLVSRLVISIAPDWTLAIAITWLAAIFSAWMFLASQLWSLATIDRRTQVETSDVLK